MDWPGFVGRLLLADAPIGDTEERKSDSLVRHTAAYYLMSGPGRQRPFPF